MGDADPAGILTIHHGGIFETELLTNLRSRDDPMKQFYTASEVSRCVCGDYWDIHLHFSLEYGSWHYGWKANRFKQDVRHVFLVTVLTKQFQSSSAPHGVHLDTLGSFPSSPFSVSSLRRKDARSKDPPNPSLSRVGDLSEVNDRQSLAHPAAIFPAGSPVIAPAPQETAALVIPCQREQGRGQTVVDNIRHCESSRPTPSTSNEQESQLLRAFRTEQMFIPGLEWDDVSRSSGRELSVNAAESCSCSCSQGAGDIPREPRASHSSDALQTLEGMQNVERNDAGKVGGVATGTEDLSVFVDPFQDDEPRDEDTHAPVFPTFTVFRYPLITSSRGPDCGPMPEEKFLQSLLSLQYDFLSLRVDVNKFEVEEQQLENRPLLLPTKAQQNALRTSTSSPFTCPPSSPSLSPSPSSSPSPSPPTLPYMTSAASMRDAESSFAARRKKKEGSRIRRSRHRIPGKHKPQDATLGYLGSRTHNSANASGNKAQAVKDPASSSSNMTLSPEEVALLLQVTKLTVSIFHL